ncbi:MAG: hypothetical protein IPK66_08140 [Rhodospirillales bacterium]|nr:hypothetical protein [Rhodospirillales bacterium]
MPTVRIIADYAANGFLLADADARAIGHLPIDDDLLTRLAAWNDRYEACDPQAFEDISGSCFDFVRFAADGLALAQAIKRALPRWTVRFWDDALDWFLARDPRTYDPTRAEYEVTLKDALAARPGAAQRLSIAYYVGSSRHYS